MEMQLQFVNILSILRDVAINSTDKGDLCVLTKIRTLACIIGRKRLCFPAYILHFVKTTTPGTHNIIKQLLRTCANKIVFLKSNLTIINITCMHHQLVLVYSFIVATFFFVLSSTDMFNKQRKLLTPRLAGEGVLKQNIIVFLLHSLIKFY